MFILEHIADLHCGWDFLESPWNIAMKNCDKKVKNVMPTADFSSSSNQHSVLCYGILFF